MAHATHDIHSRPQDVNLISLRTEMTWLADSTSGAAEGGESPRAWIAELHMLGNNLDGLTFLALTRSNSRHSRRPWISYSTCSATRSASAPAHPTRLRRSRRFAYVAGAGHVAEHVLHARRSPQTDAAGQHDRNSGSRVASGCRENRRIDVDRRRGPGPVPHAWPLGLRRARGFPADVIVASLWRRRLPRPRRASLPGTMRDPWPRCGHMRSLEQPNWSAGSRWRGLLPPGRQIGFPSSRRTPAGEPHALAPRPRHVVRRGPYRRAERVLASVCYLRADARVALGSTMSSSSPPLLLPAARGEKST